jgi:hypothetical protein
MKMDKKIILVIGIVIAILLVAGLGLTALLMQGTNNTTNNTINNTTITDNTNTDSSSNSDDTDVNAQGEFCKDCDGKGYWTCPVCGGTGKDPNDPSKPCPGGQHSCDNGKVHCYTCGGDGYISDSDPGYMQ